MAALLSFLCKSTGSGRNSEDRFHLGNLLVTASRTARVA